MDAEDVTVSRLVEMPAVLDPDMTIEDALDAMLGDDAGAGLPVVDPEGSLVGWLGQDAVLRVDLRRRGPWDGCGRSRPRSCP